MIMENKNIILEAIKNKNSKEILRIENEHDFLNSLKDVIISLIENKRNDDLKFVLDINYENNNIAINTDCLIYCIKKDYLDFAYYVLENYNFDINQQNNFPFRIALRHKYFEFAKYLYEKFKADPTDIHFRAVGMCFENYINTEHHFIFEWIWNLPDIQSKMKEINPKLFFKIDKFIKFNNF